MSEVHNVDPGKARLHVEGWGDAVVLDAFIDPRNGRWAYRIARVPESEGRHTRIIYPDQIETLHWTVRGEMELNDGPDDGARARATGARATSAPSMPVLLD